MRIYPEVPKLRTRAVITDLLLLALLVVFAWLGMKVNNTVDDVASLGRGVQDAGNSVRDGFTQAGDALGNVPLVGGDLSGALRDAGQATGGNAVAAGRQGELAIEELAQLLGWLTFLIPAGLVMIAALPRRIRKLRQLNVAAQVLTAENEEQRRLLAMRAAFSLPFGTLLSYTRDPFGDLQAGNYDALLRAVYEDCGLRAPTGRPMAGAGFEPA